MALVANSVFTPGWLLSSRLADARMLLISALAQKTIRARVTLVARPMLAPRQQLGSVLAYDLGSGMIRVTAFGFATSSSVHNRSVARKTPCQSAAFGASAMFAAG